MDKRGMEVGTIGKIILGLITLLVIVGIFLLLTGPANEQIERLIGFFRFS